MNDTQDYAGCAVIQLAGRRWPLWPEHELTFGRNPDRDIRFAHEPVDDWVSRQAGTLLGRAGEVLVRNDSRTQGIVLQACPGPETAIGPRMTVGTSPHGRLRLVVPGRHGGRYPLLIDARRLLPRPPPDDEVAPVIPAGGLPTNPAAAQVSGRELRLLAALCEPLLILAGDAAVPATYREIGERTGLKPGSVRNCLDALRQRLSDEDGIPGLRGDENGERGDYRAPLARWVLYSGTVGPAQLALLDRPGPDG